jgi:hypothetical protein
MLTIGEVLEERLLGKNDEGKDKEADRSGEGGRAAQSQIAIDQQSSNEAVSAMETATSTSRSLTESVVSEVPFYLTFAGHREIAVILGDYPLYTVIDRYYNASLMHPAIIAELQGKNGKKMKNYPRNIPPPILDLNATTSIRASDGSRFEIDSRAILWAASVPRKSFDELLEEHTRYARKGIARLTRMIPSGINKTIYGEFGYKGNEIFAPKHCRLFSVPS